MAGGAYEPSAATIRERCGPDQLLAAMTTAPLALRAALPTLGRRARAPRWKRHLECRPV